MEAQPTAAQPERLQKSIDLPSDLVAAVERWRSAQPDAPTWASTVRALLTLGLRAEGIER